MRILFFLFISFTLNAQISFLASSGQSKSITFSAATSTTLTFSWTNGTASSRIVLMKSGSAVNSNPVDNTTYTANTVFGSGTQIGTGNYVVKIGSGPVTVTGLTANTTYHVAVFEFSGSAGAEKYRVNVPPINNQKTWTTEYQTVLDRGTTLTYTLPSFNQQKVDDALVVSMIANGDWAELDVFYNFYTDGSEGWSTLNWKTPASYQCTKTGSALFNPIIGWTWGATGYLDTNYTPSTNGVKYAQNSSCFAVWVNRTSKPVTYMGAGTGALATLLSPRELVNRTSTYIQATSASSFNNPLPFELLVHGRRTASNNQLAFVNGAAQLSNSATSQALVTISLKLGARSNGGSVLDFDDTGTLRYAYAGSGTVSAPLMYSSLTNHYNNAYYNFANYRTVLGSFPDFPLSSSYSAYTTALTSLQSQISAQTETIQQIPYIGTGVNAEGGVMAPNGWMYCAPQSGDGTLTKFNIYTKERISLGSGYNGYIGGVLAGNGYIYFIPFNTAATTILKINWATDVITTFGSLSGTNQKWISGVLAGNGKIYCPMNKMDRILVIDTSNDAITYITTYNGSSTWDATTLKYAGCALASTGKILCAPLDAATILEIDPSNDTATDFGTFTGGQSLYAGVCPAPNGFLYAIPYTSATVLKINPTTHATTTFGSLTTSGSKWGSGAMALNGNIYAFPQNATTILKIDTGSDVASTISTSFTGTTKFIGTLLAPDGTLWGVPFNSTDLGIFMSPLPSNNIISPGAYLSRFINKY